MMPILFKGDDVRTGTKAKAPHRCYRQNVVNGLIEVRYSNIYKANKINFECEFYE